MKTFKCINFLQTLIREATSSALFQLKPHPLTLIDVKLCEFFILLQITRKNNHFLILIIVNYITERKEVKSKQIRSNKYLTYFIIKIKIPLNKLSPILDFSNDKYFKDFEFSTPY